jgi:hypothetical protein
MAERRKIKKITNNSGICACLLQLQKIRYDTDTARISLQHSIPRNGKPMKKASYTPDEPS